MAATKQMNGRDTRTRRQDLLVFLLLAVVVWPVLTVGVVGAYGFTVWMSQQLFGPPRAVASHAK